MPFTLHTVPPEVLVETFADLLSDRFVFTPDYSPALDELIYNLPDDDLNAIAHQIATWCQARPEIWEALEDELGKRGPAEFVPAAKPEDYKTLLKNKLRESFPEPTQKPPTSNQ
jgi:hypothetical protein